MRWSATALTLAVAISAAGCVGTKDSEAIQSQLRDIQRQVAGRCKWQLLQIETVIA